MSFESHEQSEDLGAPYELYEFVYGDTGESVYRYTNFDRDIDKMGQKWFARPISREAYKTSGKTDKSSLTIRLPVDTDLAALFTDYPPTQVVRVTIRAGHVDDPQNELLVIWVGRILSTAKEGNQAVLTCDNTIISMKRPGLRRNWQYACPYLVYGIQCGAVQTPLTATVDQVTTSGIVLMAGWHGEYPPEKFKGGMLRWRGPHGWEYRTIRDATAEGALAFIGPIRNIEPGMSISVILGCNQTKEDCANVHNNINNFGGDPWIPLKNPVKQHPYW